MVPHEVARFMPLVPAILGTRQPCLWSSYDAEADVLYVHFKQPNSADDSELTDDDIIIRYKDGEVVGLTILHASTR